MGREAEATVHWRGQIGVCRVLLEASQVILRGDLRGQISRSGIAGLTLDGDDLRINTGDGPLILTLGADTAARWAAALAKPAPSLAQKLGLGPDKRVFATGRVSDPELANALDGAVAETDRNAALLLAVLAMPKDIEAALALAQRNPSLPIWCVYPKGSGTPVGDVQVRTAFRAGGFIDTKACAVSGTLTATRYAIRRT